MTLLMVCVSAVLSSLCTIGLFLVFYKLYLRRTLHREFEELSDLFEQRLSAELEKTAAELVPEFREELSKGFEEVAQEMLPEFRKELSEGFTESARELLPEFRDEVTSGVEDAGQTLLPEFQERVRQGFKEAIGDAISGGIIDETAQNVVRKGSGIIESSLDLFFGKRRKKDDTPPESP